MRVLFSPLGLSKGSLFTAIVHTGGWQRNARKRDAKITHAISSYISAFFSSRFFERYLKKVLLPTPTALQTFAAV